MRAGFAPTRVVGSFDGLSPDGPHQGLARNLGPFMLLVVQVGFVGALVGIERAVVPVLGREEFGLETHAAVLSFILAFGLAKAPANFLAGRLADRYGRRRVLVVGWLIVLPVPAAIAVAPSWGWVVAANAVLGVQQGLCWSTALVMKTDVAGHPRRGLAIGVNEFAGYAGTAVAAYAAGALAAAGGSRVAPFVLGEGLALAGLVVALFVADTSRYLASEPAQGRFRARSAGFVVVSQAGLVTKLADVAAWGLLPLYFRDRGVSLAVVGALAAAYPATWAALQPFSGWASDRGGRRGLIVAGLAGQAGGLLIVGFASGMTGWVLGIVVLGAGTAAAYPVLLAAAGDTAPAPQRASAIGLYRLWRDLGFVVGAVTAGRLADALGIPATLDVLAAIALTSAALSAVGLRDSRFGVGSSLPAPSPTPEAVLAP